MVFNFRKISAIATSAVMLLSTAGIAAAAQYPAPFVTGSGADVAVIVGTGSGVSQLDAFEAGFIQADLQSRMGSTGGGTTTSCAGGDCYLIEQASTKVNIGDQLLDIKTSSIDDTELPNVLAELDYISGDGKTYGYTQKIELDILNFTAFGDRDYKDEKPSIGIHIDKNNRVLNYTVSWKKQPQSDTTTAGKLEDLEDSEIIMLGKSYTILNAYNASVNSNQAKLELMGGAYIGSVGVPSEACTTQGIAPLSEPTLADSKYAIRVESITSSTESKLCVAIDGGEEKCYANMNEGETRDLLKGVQLGIRDITYYSKTGYCDSVEYSLGAEKLTLQDGQTLELNDEDVDGITVNMTQTPSGSKQQLGNIIFTWQAKEEHFAADDSAITIPALGGLKFATAGFYTPATEMIKVTDDGTDAMILDVPLKSGLASVPLLFGNDSTWEYLGSDKTKKLQTTNNSVIIFNVTNNDEYFVASWNSTTDAESHLLSVVGVTKKTGINYTTIKRVGYKDSSLNVNVCEDVASGSDCKVGNIILTTSAADPDDDTVTLTINDGGSFERVYSAEGLTFYLPVAFNGTTADELGNVAWNAINLSVEGGAALTGSGEGLNATSWELVAVEEDKDGNLGAGTKQINFTLGWSGSRTRVSQIRTWLWASDGAAANDPDLETESGSDIFVDWMLSDLATKVIYNKPSGSDAQHNAELEYHGGESYGLVYLAAEGADISATSTAALPAGNIGKIVVEDSKVSSVASKNLIVVGGSCINSAAAKLVGEAACGAKFTEKTGIGAGQAIIKSYADAYATGKIALLVAGYNVADTQMASTFLQTQPVTTDAGTGVKVTSVTTSVPLTQAA